MQNIWQIPRLLSGAKDKKNWKKELFHQKEWLKMSTTGTCKPKKEEKRSSEPLAPEQVKHYKPALFHNTQKV